MADIKITQKPIVDSVDKDDQILVIVDDNGVPSLRRAATGDLSILKDEVIAETVTDWLDNHPEATTTVQDASLTESKFANSLKLKTIKDYVTPEMFGAVGDGETDDSIPIQNAINAGFNTILLRSNYLITQTITITTPIKFVGTNATLSMQGSAKLFINRTNNVIFNNIKFVGISHSVPAIHNYYSNNTFIVFCEFDSLHGGISIETGNYITIENCYIHNCVYSSLLIIGYNDTIKILKSKIINNTATGIGIAGGVSSNVTIANCYIEGNGDSERGSVYVQGINTHGIMYSQICNNIIKDNVGSALDLSGHNTDDVNTPRAKYIEVSNNIIIGNGSGIVIDSALNVIITGNRIGGGNMGISIITDSVSVYGVQNIDIIGNVFEDFPTSAGTYQGVINFSNPKQQLRNVTIENNVFNSLSVNAQAFVSTASMNFSTQEAADLVSGIRLKNNDMSCRDLTNLQRVKYVSTNAYKPYPFESVDERTVTLTGTEIANIPFGIINRKTFIITKIDIIATETGTKVTMNIVDSAGNSCFEYTDQPVYDKHRLFYPQKYSSLVMKIINITATAQITAIIYYSEMT